MLRSSRRALTIALVVLTAVAVPLARDERSASADAAAIALLNAYRATAGVQTLAENASYSAGDVNHAIYMVRNNTITHSETVGNPYYSASGLKAAQNSNLHVSLGSPLGTYRSAINGLMAAPFHALNFINPALTQTGFGDFADGSIPCCSTINYGAGIDVLSDIIDNGRYTPPPGTPFPLPWPKNGATVPLTSFSGNESPNPLTFCSGYSNPAGLPILLQTAGGTVLPNVTAWSIMDGATPLTVCEVDETKTGAGLAHDILAARNSVMLIPRNPLVVGKTYTASVTNNGLTTTWSFSIGAAGSDPTVGPVTPPSLSATPTSVVAGSNLNVTWSNIAMPSPSDWIGLYPATGTPDNVNRTTFRFTNGMASGTLPLTVPAGTTPGSTYELRLFSNNSYTRLATFGPITVTAAPSLTLTATPNPVAAGSNLNVTWGNIPTPSQYDWIGLYPASGTPHNTNRTAFMFTNGMGSGTMPLMVPAGTASGATYELRLFSNNSYTLLKTFGPITINGPPPPTVTATPNPVSAGSNLTVSWSNIAMPSQYDWIGLYPATGTPHDTNRTAFMFTNGMASGSMPLMVPAGTASGATYELRLFANNSYTLLKTFGPITVNGPPPPTLTATPNPVAAGSNLNVTWGNIAAPSQYDWIGLYPASGTPHTTNRTTFRFTNGMASGTLPLTVPVGATPGTTYELRLFANNSYTLLKTFGPITITAPPPPTVAASPTTVARGANLNVTWGNIAMPSQYDWIGLYPASGTPHDTNRTTFMFTNGMSSGSAPLMVPAGAAPGTTYQLRLFSNNSYTILATSTPITVQ